MLDPDRDSAVNPARWCSPRTAGPAGSRSPTSGDRCSRSGGCGCRGGWTTACRGCAATWRPACATPASRHRGAGRAPGPGQGPVDGGGRRAGRRCAGSCGRTRCTDASSARTTPAGPSGTTGCERETEQLRQTDGGHHRLAGADLRPDRPAAHRARLPRRALRGHRARQAAGPAVGRVGPARRRVPAARRVGRAGPAGAGGGGVRAGVRVAPGRPRPGPGAGRPGERRRWTTPPGSGPSLEADERRHRLDRTREPDPGFAWPVQRWARGESLGDVLAAAEQNGQELSAGDFVRWCRQTVDLLDQVAKVAGADTPVGRNAAAAVRSIRRGVVAAGAGLPPARPAQPASDADSAPGGPAHGPRPVI